MGNDLVIRSFRQWVVLHVHRTSHNRHSTFDSFVCRRFFHSSYERPRYISCAKPPEGEGGTSAIQLIHTSIYRRYSWISTSYFRSLMTSRLAFAPAAPAIPPPGCVPEPQRYKP